MWPTLHKTWKWLDSYGVLNLADAVHVDITNVCEWANTDWDMEDEAKRKQVFGFCPGLRPSFDSTWFEWRTNKIEIMQDGGTYKVDGRALWAVHCPAVFPG